MAEANAIWGKRLKSARTEVGLSQKELGIAAGLDPSVASTRINRYELGIHKADYLIAQRLAAVLKIPVAYLYAEEDELAALILSFGRLTKKKKAQLISVAEDLLKG